MSLEYLNGGPSFVSIITDLIYLTWLKSKFKKLILLYCAQPHNGPVNNLTLHTHQLTRC